MIVPPMARLAVEETTAWAFDEDYDHERCLQWIPVSN